MPPQPRSRQSRYEKIARATASKYGIPVRLFLSLIDHESSWQPTVASPAGAIGLTQLMPGTARTLGVDPFNPRQNLDGGARYLSTQYKKLGSWRDALRAYNVGPSGAKDPNAGLEYANSVLAGRNAAKFLDSPAGGNGGGPGIRPPMGTFAPLTMLTLPEMAKIISPKDKAYQRLAKSLATPGQKFMVGPPAPGPTAATADMTTAGGAKYASGYQGKTYVPGTAWKGTHVTDGLDWNSGARTAADLFPGPPGTPVGAPESGKVVKWGGAQGGQALYFLSDTGHLYWMGHIENMLTVGVHVGRGQPIAVISSHHSTPHLHIDRYYGRNPSQYY